MTKPHWTTACPDWAERLKSGRSIIPLPIFPSEADAALEVFKELKIVDALGSPTFGDASGQWLIDLVAAIFGAYDSDSGRRLIREVFVQLPKKNSKALALDTPIPTPNGWSTMGELTVGDQVFGADGRACLVTATSPVFTDHQCFKVDFSNDESVIADAGHLWKTASLSDNIANKCGSEKPEKVRTTAQIKKTLLRGDGARNHSIRMPAPLAPAASAVLDVEPYTLGAWLGDGTSAGAQVTGVDEEIFQNIVTDGYSIISRRLKPGTKCWTVNFSARDESQCYRGHDKTLHASVSNGKCLLCERQTDNWRRNGVAPPEPVNLSLVEKLRNLGVLNNKHIPAQYLRGSYGQRLALLQGLMDTDGTVNQNGRVLGFCSVNLRLATDVAELLATFGIKFTWRKSELICNGRKVPGVGYNLQFMAFRDEIPIFALQRKHDRMLKRSDCRSTPRSRTVQITAITPIDPVPVKCISVDSPENLFLFGRTMLPTHNSTAAAGIMMTALIRNWRESAELIILAPTVEIAGNSFKPSQDMVRADEDLTELVQVQTHIKTLTLKENGGTLKVVAADANTVGGKKASWVLVDELHLFGKQANAENMLVEATGGLISRNEGIVIYLTTQSDEPPAGLYKLKLDYARGVRDGTIHDPQFLPVIYEFPQDMIDAGEHKNPNNFHMVNPNWGRSVDAEAIIREMRKAEVAGESSMRGFLAKHLNVEIGLALRGDRWNGADFWEANAKIPLARGRDGLQLIIDQSEVIVIGIDGGGLDDLLGLCVMGRHEETKRWLAWSHAWAHQSVLDRRKSEAPRLLDFEKAGDLTICRTPGDDVEEVADIVEQCEESGLLDRIGVDQAGIGGIVDAITERGIEFERVVGIPQGWKMVSAIKTAERKLAADQLWHPGTALMAYAVSNAKVEARGNAVIITKQTAGTAKIDPLMALFDAIALMGMNPKPRKRKYQMMFV